MIASRRAGELQVRSGPLFVTAVLCIAALPVGVVVTSYDYWGALAVAPALMLAGGWMVRRLARADGGVRVANLAVYGLLIKLVASMARYVVAFVIYSGQADVRGYDNVGKRLADQFRSFDFQVEGRVVGTGFIKILTGTIYSFTGPTILGGFLVYSFFGFVGAVLLYRAFCIAVPDGDHVRYAKLLFFLPSLAFWPSSIGKEAWMTMTLGIGAYGAARILTRARGGFVVLGVGLAGMSMVRPHVALLLFFGLAIGYLVRRDRRGSKAGRPIAKIVGLVVLVGVGVIVVGRAESYFGVENIDQSGVDQVLDRATSGTDEGGSAFAPAAVHNPIDFFWGATTVLVRPFPWEANNPQAMAASIEGVFLLGLIVRHRSQLWRAIRDSLRDGYAALCCTYVIIFIFAFSRFGNFGVIVRQRVQVLPFVLVLLYVAERRRTVPGRVVRTPQRKAVGPGAELVARPLPRPRPS